MLLKSDFMNWMTCGSVSESDFLNDLILYS